MTHGSGDLTIASDIAQKILRHARTSPTCTCAGRVSLDADRVGRLEHQAGQKIELDREPRTAVQREARDEAGAREKAVGLFEVAIGEQVLPRHQHLVHDEDGVVLVDPRRQRVIERTAHRRRRHLVGGAADQLHARTIHRDHREQRHLGPAQRGRAVIADEVVMGERGAGRDHLGAADDHAGVGLLFDVNVDVHHVAGRPPLVDWRVDERVIQKEAALLNLAIPVQRRFADRARKTQGWRRACRSDSPCNRANGPSSRRRSAPTRRSRHAPATSSSTLLGTLKNLWVKPPLPVSVGVVSTA